MGNVDGSHWIESGTLWPDPDAGPWLIRVEFGPTQDGRVDAVGIELRSFHRSDDKFEAAAVGDVLPRRGEPSRGISTKVWREVPIASVVGTLRRRTLLERTEYGTEPAPRAWKRAPDRGAVSLQEIARVYREAWLAGRPPTAAVAETFHLTTRAAAQRVWRARDAGLLPKTTKGRSEAADAPPPSNRRRSRGTR